MTPLYLDKVKITLGTTRNCKKESVQINRDLKEHGINVNSPIFRRRLHAAGRVVPMPSEETASDNKEIFYGCLGHTGVGSLQFDSIIYF